MGVNAGGNTVTLCAIMRDEGRYMLEWVAYYRMLGVTDIVIYDNNSAPPFRLLLADMARANLIEHVIWDNDVLASLYTPEQIEATNPQQLAYDHCQARISTDWIAVFDADELLVLHKHPDIGSFLSKFGEDVGSVCVNWRIFGTGGVESRATDHLLSEISFCSESDFEENRHFKSITRVPYASRHGTHMAVLKKGLHVAPSGRPVIISDFGRSDLIEHDIAELNHYVLKSKEEFEAKKLRGIASFSDLDDPRRTARFTQRYFDALDRNEMTLARSPDAIAALKEEISRVETILAAHRVSIRAKS